ncbi:MULTISPECIES: hypothetical protein [Bradyrhizobium]|uniref:hypothetical protein n=3 Tax=Bradyrhizobium pachyrhizi TaxID=280333 RepID=UPI000414B807
MAGFERHRLFPYYLNSRRLGLLADVNFAIEAQSPLVENSGDRVLAMRDVAATAQDLLRQGRFSNLAEVVATKDVDDKRILGFVWGVFTFSGAAEAIRRAQEGKPPRNATLKAAIPLAATEFDMLGEMSIDHFFSTTSVGVLKGKKRMLVAGHFEFHGHRVEVFPYIIGEEIEAAGPLPMPIATSIRVYAQDIDQFSRVEHSPQPTAADLKAIESMPEVAVKQAFADIIGEPYVSKDWGGEKSDLQTARLTIEDEPTSAAFLFKGPSVSGPLHPGNMGKRGNQLIRAFDEPASGSCPAGCTPHQVA